MAEHHTSSLAMLKTIIETRHGWLIVAAISMGLVSLDAQAETIPPEYLEKDYDNCIVAEDSKRHRQYCRCVVEEIEKTMDLCEYLDVTADFVEQEAAGTDALDVVASNQKLSDIVAFCLRKTAQ